MSSHTPTVRQLLAALDDVMQGRSIPSDAQLWLNQYRKDRARCAEYCHWCGEPQHGRGDSCPALDHVAKL